LIEHRTSPQEIKELLNVADRDLLNAETPGLSPEWRLSIAYNAALQAAVAALAASGDRAARESHHFRAIQSLSHTGGKLASHSSPGVTAGVTDAGISGLSRKLLGRFPDGSSAGELNRRPSRAMVQFNIAVQEVGSG
jgi:hypothetical protein